MRRKVLVLAVVFYCVTIESGGSFCGQQNNASEQPEGKPPNFNFKLRQFLVEGTAGSARARQPGLRVLQRR